MLPNGTANDVAIAWAPGGPILIAAYLTGADGIAAADRDAILAGVAKVVTASFRGQPHG